uniref:Uncharacterized protein n=1 Tax=Nelumbo nucifera TaxID=4432 RepID=A0A822ZJX6_NELNU|nr:TPA_asm: hypothetical protein HUJ06_003060 [Nelumbo nucifera]
MLFTNNKDFLFSEDIKLGQTGCSVVVWFAISFVFQNACSGHEKFKLLSPNPCYKLFFVS